MKFLRNGKNAVTPYKIDNFGGTIEHRVGTNAGDTPLKFQLKTRRSTRALCRFCVTGLCIVTTSNSIAGLRNEPSLDTLSRDLLGTTVNSSIVKTVPMESGGTFSLPAWSAIHSDMLKSRWFPKLEK